MSIDSYGRILGVDPARIEGMFFPVQCATCHGLYDLGKVEVRARYADCSVWRTPCCDATADDRGETGWKSRRDYYPLGRDGRRLERGEFA